MEINGEVNIEIDQYADVSIEIDTDQLAEELAINHNFVDDTVLHAHVEEYCDSYVDDLVTERVHQETQELRDQVSELQPDNNYVRINDLHTIIKEIVRAEISVAFAAGHHKMLDRLNGKENQ